MLLILLLLPAMLLTGARALDPQGGGWVRLVSFTPYAVVLYGAALLLLLPMWLRARGARRVTARALSVVAAVCLLTHAFWASGPFLGTSRAAAAGEPAVRLMTANLRLGQADTSRVVQVALRNRVDVLVLQEVTSQARRSLARAGLRKAYPHVAGKAAPGTDGTMVFSRHPLRRVSRLDTGFGSYRMSVRLPGGAVQLLAVHPRPPIGDARDWWLDHRAIRAAARSLHGPAVIAGDLNATMDHAPMRELVGRGYDDAATSATSQWQPTWPAAGQVSRFGVALPSLLPIDHVLVRGGPVALRTESVTIEGSDHRALVAILGR
jgi:endonuclease/exonuclease/phosphatase (EEP) superfamily protein YafD